MTVRVLIVDDEPLARRGVRELLARHTDAVEIHEAVNGEHAIRLIREHAPDVVFLDIQMPGVDGFGVIEAIGASRMPPVIFVTAHDRYALNAFEAQATDYLLKPIDPQRFKDAWERASRAGEARDLAQLRESLASLTRLIRQDATDRLPAQAIDDRLRVRQGGRVILVDPREVDWLESVGNYVILHLQRDQVRHRATMDQMQSQLGGAFVRIRRSTLVRAAAVRYCEPYGKGTFVVVLKDQTRLISSRFYRSDLAPLLGR